MKLQFLPCGDLALSVKLGDSIDPAVNQRAARLGALAEEMPGVIEAVPTYCGVTIHYNPEILTYQSLTDALSRLELEGEAQKDRVLVEIPVCYGGEYGPDLEELAAHCGLSVQEVIAIHSGRDYPVYMLGFTPGFPYLGGMDTRIAMPRLSTPRTRIPPGSVGIAGEQTGIYPVASPGGWRLIGRTPLKLFDTQMEQITLLKPGMRVRFIPMTTEAFEEVLG